MISSTVRGDTLRRCPTAGKYWIRLRVAPKDREDAWDLCRAALHYGGVEVRDCCFAFASEEQWLTASEALRFRFGPEYLETVDSAEGR